MNARLSRVAPARTAERGVEGAWSPGPSKITVGKDVLELLSTSMYVDPMTIYREYVQNAADSIDDARVQGLLSSRAAGELSVALDSAERSIRLRDNGTGVPCQQFVDRLTSLGASAKRATSARGFRGVGRLAGLGYCQELVFRSRASGESLVSELRWDCRRLRSELRSAVAGRNLTELVREIVSVRRVGATAGQPDRFFEVELVGVIRHRNDRLLNPVAVGEYLSQVGPVPFSPDFRFGDEIAAVVAPHVAMGQLDIRINGATKPLYRPHRNGIQVTADVVEPIRDVAIQEIPGVDGGVAAIAWVLHHGYSGAIPAASLIKGLRLRTGNIQVGDQVLLEDLFPEPRFNSWSVGEIHIIDRRLIPNGRRDHFEQNVHLDNLLNHLAPIARDIARRCRQSSINRKWLRDFELHKHAAIEDAETVGRGGLSVTVKKAYADTALRSLEAMKRISETRFIADELRSSLKAQCATTATRVAKLLKGAPTTSDPIARFRPEVRAAYQRIIALIYECVTTKAAARSIVTKILGRLSDCSTRNVRARHAAAIARPGQSRRAGRRGKKSG